MNVLAQGLRFPEGPAFAPDGDLWCVELKGGGLCRLGGTGTPARIPTGGEPNGIAIAGDGSVWFCDAAGSVRLHVPGQGGTRTLLRQDGRPNDLAFDGHGNLLFTCPNDGRQQPQGFVCCRAPDGTIERIAEGLYFPNGLAFHGDELVLAETYRQRLWRGRWDGRARRWDGRVWAEGLVGAPGPDGLAFAADGLLWVAVYGSGQVMAVDPEGRIVRRLELPGRNPTNCAFDPLGRHGLVVTEAERGEILSFPDLGPGAPLAPQPAAVLEPAP